MWLFSNGMPFLYKLAEFLYHFVLFLVLWMAFLDPILGVYDGVGGLRQGVEGLRGADGGQRRTCVWLLGVCAEMRRVRGAVLRRAGAVGAALAGLGFCWGGPGRGGVPFLRVVLGLALRGVFWMLAGNS